MIFWQHWDEKSLVSHMTNSWLHTDQHLPVNTTPISNYSCIKSNFYFNLFPSFTIADLSTVVCFSVKQIPSHPRRREGGTERDRLHLIDLRFCQSGIPSWYHALLIRRTSDTFLRRDGGSHVWCPNRKWKRTKNTLDGGQTVHSVDHLNCVEGWHRAV